MPFRDPTRFRPRAEALEARENPTTAGWQNLTVDASALLNPTATTAADPVSVTGPLGGAYAVGSAGGVSVYAADGHLVRSVTPFPGYSGELRVTQADVTGDGVADVVVGTGPGSPAQVAVIDGATGSVRASWRPFEAGFAGGVFVASADLDGDGKADVIVTPDDGGGPVVAVYSGAGITAGAGAGAQTARFLGISDPNFRGGARVAAGDLNGDGKVELVVAAGTGGGPRVSVLDGGAAMSGARAVVVPDFFAYDPSLRNGVYVGVGDVTGDGYGDLILGAGPGGGPRVSVLNGHTLTAGGPAAALSSPVADFLAGDPADRSGVSITAVYVDGDVDVLTATGANEAVRVYRLVAGGVSQVGTLGQSVTTAISPPVTTPVSTSPPVAASPPVTTVSPPVATTPTATSPASSQSAAATSGSTAAASQSPPTTQTPSAASATTSSTTTSSYWYTTGTSTSGSAPAATSPPVVVPTPTATASTTVSTPTVVSPPASPPAAAATTTSSPTSIGAAVLAYAQAHVGQVVTDPAGTGCAALVTAALRASGGDPTAAFTSTTGPNPLHYVWGQVVYQQDKSGQYAAVGALSAIQPGDIIQFDGYAESDPDGSQASAAHHTAIVESVDAANGTISVIQQNAGGYAGTARGTYDLQGMTAGVVSVYRPAAA